MFSYRFLLKQAWDITWHHKYLWFLGLFATLVASGGAWEYQALSQNLNSGIVGGSYYQLNNITAISDLIKNFGLGIIDLFHQGFWTALSVLSVLLIVIIILVFFIWLAVTSQAGLINDVKEISESKKKDLQLTVSKSLTAGHHHFWTVLGLNLIIKILTAAIFFIVSLPLLFLVVEDTILLSVIYTILFVIFVPVSVGISLMINYVISYRVLDNYSFITSLDKGTSLFKKNWLVSIELGIILFIITFLASALLLLVMSIFLLPLLLLGVILNLNWLLSLVVFIAMFLVITLGAVMTTFQITTWTILFLNLKSKGAIAKLERLFNRFHR